MWKTPRRLYFKNFLKNKNNNNYNNLPQFMSQENYEVQIHIFYMLAMNMWT